MTDTIPSSPRSAKEAQTEFYKVLKDLIEAETKIQADSLTEKFLDDVNSFTTTLITDLRTYTASTSSPEATAISNLIALIDVIIAGFALSSDSLTYSPKVREVEHHKRLEMLVDSLEKSGDSKRAQSARDRLAALKSGKIAFDD